MDLKKAAGGDRRDGDDDEHALSNTWSSRGRRKERRGRPLGGGDEGETLEELVWTPRADSYRDAGTAGSATVAMVDDM